MSSPCDVDSRFNQIHSISGESYYNANNLTLPIEDNSPYGMKEVSILIGLYFRPYINWKLKCRGAYLRLMANGRKLLNEIE